MWTLLNPVVSYHVHNYVTRCITTPDKKEPGGTEILFTTLFSNQLQPMLLGNIHKYIHVGIQIKAHLNIHDIRCMCTPVSSHVHPQIIIHGLLKPRLLATPTFVYTVFPRINAALE